jgi:hypothetical protein
MTELNKTGKIWEEAADRMGRGALSPRGWRQWLYVLVAFAFGLSVVPVLAWLLQ